MKAGPKGSLSAPPLDLRGCPRPGRPLYRLHWALRHRSQGHRGPSPAKLRPWQRQIVHGVLDETGPRQGSSASPPGMARARWPPPSGS